MLIKQKIIYKFSIAALLQPVYNPYWVSYGTEQIIKKPDVLDNLLQTAISILTQDNTEIIKQYKKDLKQPKQIKHNIEFFNNIEWSLLEHLLLLRKELDDQKFKFVFNPNFKYQTQWKQIGELEIYGLSPYRHQNHFIHEYIYKTEQNKVTFEVKPQIQERSDIEEKSEKLAKPILDSLEKEKQDVAGLFGRARNFINKVNKLVINENNFKQENTQFSWKKYVLEPSKSDRILVRDYEYEFEGIMTIQDQNGHYLSDTKFIEQIQPKLNKIQIRTESWLETKESDSTIKGKRQVLSDLNCILRGNPWVWVKKFDEEEL
ncbi:unnamed protein product [Paramecium sonneborni]|uniref:Uncharacterized protein n=1 Tax=Paramecium sonneborni TaxID=65129 RepID=A0A8S1KN83_9CILI|nr:unnamed protein product [Paramecium sonneborni]